MVEVTDSPSPSAAPPPDLHASGPGSVTLVPDCGIYRGTVTITVRNTGSPFDWGNVLVHIPTGVEVDFNAGDPGFYGCGFINGPTYYGCAGPVVPAFGGVFTRVVHLVANYAPQANAMDLGVFSVQYLAKPDSVGADPTPNDNTVTIEVLLAKA